MEDDVVIRTARVDDVAELVELRRAFTFEDMNAEGVPRADFDESFTGIVSSGIRSGRWIVWVAEVGGAIVSHAFVGILEKIPRPVVGHRTIGYLTNVYTRPEFRGRGVGAQVLDAVTAWALESDVELLAVWPSEASVAHYERHGFGDREVPLVWLHPGTPA